MLKKYTEKTSVAKTIIALIVVAILELITFYILLPPLNIHDIRSWMFQGFFVILFLVSTFFCSKGNNIEQLNVTIVSKIVTAVIALGLVVVVIGGLTSLEIFNASRYSSLIKVKECKFEDEIAQTDTVNDIALMDTKSARVVGERAIGSLSDLVSQYVINQDYNQIDYNGQPMKVATLEYADFFKWFNNRKNGIPGYVLVDPVEFEAEYIKLDKPIKYTSSARFNDKLQRKLRFEYPTAIFEGYYFELDNDGNPYYICPTLTAKIGLFGGKDVKGVVIFDPCTGKSKYYDVKNVPQWVDRVYDGDLATRKFDWYGTLSDGFINSIIGQKDCKITTEDYGYKVMDDDVWIYTGVTSVIDDSSNIGFVMINARTGETRYFKAAGAEEFSAMDAAEGQVQNLGYKASFPAIINIGGEPTYFMVLKDKSNLVKQYALVNVKKYSIVATGTTQRDTLSSYNKLMKENNLGNKQAIDDMNNDLPNVNIQVTDIEYITTDGETYVYISDENNNVYKELFAEDESLIFIKQGAQITIYYEEDKKDGKKNADESQSTTDGESQENGLDNAKYDSQNIKTIVKWKAQGE